MSSRRWATTLVTIVAAGAFSSCATPEPDQVDPPAADGYAGNALLTQVSSDAQLLASAIEGQMVTPDATLASIGLPPAPGPISPTALGAMGVTLTGANTAHYVSGTYPAHVVCAENPHAGVSATYSGATGQVTAAKTPCTG